MPRCGSSGETISVNRENNPMHSRIRSVHSFFRRKRHIDLALLRSLSPLRGRVGAGAPLGKCALLSVASRRFVGRRKPRTMAYAASPPRARESAAAQSVDGLETTDEFSWFHMNQVLSRSRQI